MEKKKDFKSEVRRYEGCFCCHREMRGYLLHLFLRMNVTVNPSPW